MFISSDASIDLEPVWSGAEIYTDFALTTQDYPTNLEMSKRTNFTILNTCLFVQSNTSSLPWNDQHELMPYKTYLLYEQIMTAILVPIACLIGIPANFLNCIVFYQHGLQHRINVLLFSHSFTDLAFVSYIFAYMLDRFCFQLIGQYRNDGPIGVFMTNSGLHTFIGFSYASGFISTLIACERCLCIVKPFSVEGLLKTKTVCGLVCSATVILVSLHYILTERYKKVCVFDSTSKQFATIYFPSDFYARNTLLVNIMNGALYGFGLPFVYIVVTSVTTIITAFQLRTAVEWRLEEARTRKYSHKEVILTKMLISTSCLFIVCKSPDVIARIAPIIVPGLRVGGDLQNTFMAAIYLWMLVSVLNSAFNICIYYKMGSKFRRTARNLCGK